jgi:DNA-binding NarL/FixJ family response regulator
MTEFRVLTVPLRHGSAAFRALTQAESEVAVLAAAGMTNNAIARTRRTSVRTAANQMASILAKLGLESRFALAGRFSDGAECAATALDFWHGLVDGRLSLVAHFPSGQRHHYIARETPRGAGAPRLDGRERRLAEIIGSGKSEKIAAQELGVGPTTASVILKEILMRLGLRSRAELVMLVQATHSQVREEAQ